ncbi:MAG: hypothetical protein IKL94_03365 [Clostridia bacterium]|nr:hypothetical protein [Clostridia bacterium]
MELVWIVGIILFVGVILTLSIAYACFYLAFYVPRKEQKSQEEFDLPVGKTYEPYHEMMIAWMKQTRKLPYTEYSITSYDGLKLYAKYYEHKSQHRLKLCFTDTAALPRETFAAA